MKLTDEQRSKIRQIKGAPSTVLFCLLLMGGTAQKKDFYWLYNDRTVSKAIGALNDAGLIVKDGKFWTLTAGGRQMVLSTGYQQINGDFDQKLVESTTLSPSSSKLIIKELKNDLNIKTTTEKSRTLYDFSEIDDYLIGLGVWPNVRKLIVETLGDDLDEIKRWFPVGSQIKKQVHRFKNGITPEMGAAADDDPAAGENDPDEYISGDLSDIIEY